MNEKAVEQAYEQVVALRQLLKSLQKDHEDLKLKQAIMQQELEVFKDENNKLYERINALSV